MSLKNVLCFSAGVRVLIIIVGMGLIFFRCVKSENQAVVWNIPPMLDAAASGKYDVLQKLLKDGVSPNMVDEAGSSDSSLMGSMPPYLMNVGNSALAFAVFNGTYPINQKCIDLMLQHQANPRLINKEGQPPFFWVVKIDYKDLRMEILGKLIKFGADINLKDYKSYTILEKIVETYDTTGVDIMLDWWGKLINPEVLRAAKERAEQYNLADVLVVLNKKRIMAPVQGMQWNPADIDKRQNLRDEIEITDKKVAMSPIKDPHWDPSAIDKRMGLNDLHFAVISNDLGWVEACLGRGANINRASEDEYGMKPLHYAVLHYSPAMVEYLISKKADVNSADLFLNTPLHMLAWLDNFDVAKQIADILLKNGAKLNAKNKEGNSLLHTLIYNNNKNLIEYIGNIYQFDVDSKNNNRESALDIAGRLNRKGLLQKIKRK